MEQDEVSNDPYGLTELRDLDHVHLTMGGNWRKSKIYKALSIFKVTYNYKTVLLHFSNSKHSFFARFST